MAAGGGLVVRLWKEWGVQILVVTSFLLQLILLILGGLRRRSSSAALLAFLWLSYLMADNIAVYALGHMSLESRPGDDGLVAFWATFFLLHLGGQDTITAFSLEDNQLWRRHLLTLLVQASGAGYAIYRYTIPGTWNLVSATIVMFIVGFLKYGERVWALKRGNNGNFALLKVYSKTSQERDRILKTKAKMDREELILFDAHYMFHFCMGAFINVSLERWCTDTVLSYLDRPLPYKFNMDMYDLVEAELSLLYDLFYTKAQVVHSWQGYLIRVISLLGTVSAFLLFRLDDGKGAHNRVDVSISYLLLVGAIALETTSVCTIVGSTWTCGYLHCQGWSRTNAMILCIRRLIQVGSQRKWLYSIGQHNVLDYCTRDQTNWMNRIVEATVLKKWRRTMKFSVNTKITMKFKEIVLGQVVKTMTLYSETWSILDAPGKCVLTKYELWGNIGFSVEGRDFAHCILIWQVATDIYLCCCDDNQHQSRCLNAEEDDKVLVDAIKVLSKYMGFLVIHPSLLPGGVPSDSTINNLEELWKTSECCTSKEFARSLLDHKRDDRPYISLAGELLGNRRNLPMLQVIFGVWVEFLCYAAYHSTGISHCIQLGRGGEFLSVIRLVIDHIELFQRYSKRLSSDADKGSSNISC